MSHLLTLFEATEIRELLFFKITSLGKSKLFLNTVKEQHHTGRLEADISLCAQEIADLEHILSCSAV